MLSELRKRKRCHPSVAKWQSGVSAAACFVSVVSLMEIVHGLTLVTRNVEYFADNGVSLCNPFTGSLSG